MKICSKCGFENNDENLFCGKCGSPFAACNPKVTVCKKCKKEYDASLQFCPFCGTKTFQKSKVKIIHITILTFFGVVIVIIFLLLKKTFSNSNSSFQPVSDITTNIDTSDIITEPHKLEIDPYDFCSIYYEGYNGHASAYLYVNSYDFSYLLDSKEYSSLSNSDKLKIQKIVDNLKGNVSSINISNGNTITVNLDYDEEALENIGVFFTINTLKFTVSGLKDLTRFNPFENMFLYTSGLSGSAFIEKIDYSSCQYANLLDEYTDITYSTQSGKINGELSNGDIVTLKFEYDKDELWSLGYELTQDSGDFKISSCREPLTYDKLLDCDKSKLKAAFDSEAYNLLASSDKLKEYATNIIPFAYVYMPSVPEYYIYNTDHPENFLDCRAVAIYSSTDGKGKETSLAVFFEDIWCNGNGDFEYTLKSNTGFSYNGFAEADKVKYISGNANADAKTSAWVNYFESVRKGWTMLEDASTTRIERASTIFIITPQDSYNALPSFDEVFGGNTDRALSLMAEYLKASDLFLELNPECADMSPNEIAQNLYNNKYCDNYYFSGDYLYMCAAGEKHELQYAIIPKSALANYFSYNVAYYYDRSK